MSISASATQPSYQSISDALADMPKHVWPDISKFIERYTNGPQPLFPTADEVREQDFAAAMSTLEDTDAESMMDGFEVEAGTGMRNNRFGTYGMQGLANLTPTDPLWAKYAPNTTEAERIAIIDAAKTAMLPENAGLLAEVNGGDGIFEVGDIAAWNARKAGEDVWTSPEGGYTLEGNKFTFADALTVLSSPEGIYAADMLEVLDGTGMQNDRFGDYGLTRLANLTSDSPEWNTIGPNLTVEQRNQLIEAAKVAVAPENRAYLQEASGGDFIFEVNEMQGWLARFREGDSVSDGVIGSYKQGAEGNCWALASISAVASTPDGRHLLGQSITQNVDGTYTVIFPGDPSQAIVVTEEDLKGYNSFSTGDKDVKILEVAMEKYAAANPSWRGVGTTTQGGWGVLGIALLTGQEAFRFATQYDPTATKNFLIWASELPDTGVIYFSSEVDPATGLPGAHGNGFWHGFYITDIDLENGTVTFVNPWDTGNPITMSIDDFSTRVAGFDTTTFA